MLPEPLCPSSHPNHHPTPFPSLSPPEQVVNYLTSLDAAAIHLVNPTHIAVRIHWISVSTTFSFINDGDEDREDGGDNDEDQEGGGDNVED
nr:probable glucan endo-1,3-beta-glucosidase A6 [Ipomoea trifida]